MQLRYVSYEKQTNGGLARPAWWARGPSRCRFDPLPHRIFCLFLFCMCLHGTVRDVHAGAWARLFPFFCRWRASFFCVSLNARWTPSCALAGRFAAPSFHCFRWTLGCDDDWVPIRIYTPGLLQINKHKQNTRTNGQLTCYLRSKRACTGS